MNRMIAITISPGATTAAVRLIVSGKRLAHHPAAGGDQDEEEGAEQLREQPSPLLGRVLEVLHRLLESCEGGVDESPDALIVCSARVSVMTTAWRHAELRWWSAYSTISS